MAEDRIQETNWQNSLVDLAGSAEDPIRARADMITDFVIDGDVSAKIGAEPYEASRRSRNTPQWASRPALGSTTGYALKVPKIRRVRIENRA